MKSNATESNQQTTNPNPAVLMQMMTGFWVSQSIFAAAKLRVADQLKQGARSVSDLAKAVNANETHLYRVLRALSSTGIFRELENRTFELTPTAELLRADHPDSMRPIAMMLAQENVTAWGQLSHAMETGASPFEMAYGMNIYEYFKHHPERGEAFNEAMTALVRNDYASILAAYDFSQFNRIVDVGGGHGTLLIAILKQYPNLSGILFDLPQVAAEAKPALEKAGLADRCRIVSGSFFEAIAEGGDAYLLSRVLHGFSDEQSIQILKNIHTVLPDHGALLIMEFVLQSGNDPSTAQTKFMDVNMLVFSPGGRDRTQDEYTHLLKEAGFALNHLTPTPSGIAILEARKAVI